MSCRVLLSSLLTVVLFGGAPRAFAHDNDGTDGFVPSSSNRELTGDTSEEDEPDPGDDASGSAQPSPGTTSGMAWTRDDLRVDPAVSAVLFPTAGGGYAGLLALGAEAAVPFREDTEEALHWAGTARGVGQVLVGPNLYNGYAARVGAFVGPQLGPARIRLGPDVFTSRYVLSGVDASPLTGVGLPLTASVAGKRLGVRGGVTPAWYLAGGWEGVDWSTTDAFGLGDEFTYELGAFVSTRVLSLGLGYTHRIMSIGVQRGLVFGVGF